ncbi:catalase [Streptomyces rapamycinicus]|uniref:Catalase n=2 Tax=Streptomyces rapamycinicus TaxID=1226757 RepID=A0A0A0NB58_STRRN|nr:catalase [Streptomyces rapamycinicus]AGP54204.1 hydroperoxidase II [Streptomyces rapamycinicus NRRL 5491]MBB4781705.1 catalase [Streptomyces rapamycinicus]RLV73653.1 catalase [Streptomyces rapamycinicus NRRL 5491]UTO62281.1 catalase [Streptomyces rapamycinicus]UTP30236.1 catalase [Streptomyces rapamycinicus NRRL 5491]
MTEDRKERQRDIYRAPDPAEGPLTTDQGVAVDHTDDSLTVGERGPTLMEDFHFREKLTHFDHERIPERVVHARGAGAYGYFEPYESCAEFTRAAFLQDPSVRTPVFVRFSTVQGPRGSADTVRDVRGFATKFYTSEGNYDLVGNNMPVFFIQDGIKFPDFVHALKPEPQNEIPTGASAHDTLWDFVSLQPETMHMMMWLMSDRAIPRSYRMMQGFGVHTFRFVDAQGRGTFVKFHWKPKLGVHSLVWDEAQECQGRDPDFNRRDLWDAIEAGQYPEYELGVQLIPEEDEFNFEVDLLDATKIIPEEQVPVRPIGHMVLNRNPDNFFAETEQVAFHTANVVPGIDFTNDPLLQARNFSYLDTQLIRLGGPNFSQLPVNQPVTPARTNQRDGYHQTMLHRGTNYSPNSLGGGCPALAGADGYAFSHYAERVEGHKIRERSESFKDFYSQAALFWNSMSDWERRHIVDAFRFELGKVGAVHVRERTVEQLAQVDYDLASQVAQGIGVALPEPGANNHKPQASPALSFENLQGDGSIRTRQIAVLVMDGVDTGQLTQAQEALTAQGAIVEALAPHDGKVVGADGNGYAVDRALPTVASVLYDAVLLPGGPTGTPGLASDSEAMRFVRDAYRHGKPIAALGSGVGILSSLDPEGLHIASGHGHVCTDRGVVTDTTTGAASEEFTHAFTEAIAAHRHWDRPRVRC